MAEYGIPYQGSKGSICNELIRVFPKADNFYDLFGGGFSVTHAMLLRRSSHYKHFHFNEIRPGFCELIKDAIAGKYNYSVFKPEFVTREMFFDRVEHCAYTKILWSFGNDGATYLFSKEIEPYKKSLHNAIALNQFDALAEQTLGLKSFNSGYDIKQKRLFLRNKIEFYRKTKVPEFLWPFLKDEDLAMVKANRVVDDFTQLQALTGLQRLQQLQQLQQLERLQGLERLSFYNTSYEQVQIKENSIVYCDIPYLDTRGYGAEFNHKAFFDWADAQSHPVFISEYNVADSRFKLVFKINKRSMMSCNKDKCVDKVEKLYANKAAQELKLV